MDHFYVLFICSLTWLLFDYFGIWANHVTKILGNDPFVYLFVVPFCLINLTFYTLGLTFTYFDLKTNATGIKKYKIQPGTNSPLSFQRLKDLMILVAFNQFIIGALGQYIFYKLYLKWHAFSNVEMVPFIPRILLELIFFVIIEEIGFFYLHWSFHSRFLYARFHKIHHEWTSTVAVGE